MGSAHKRARMRTAQTLPRIRASVWDPARFPELGRGGEAIVHQLRADTVAKVFLQPDAPDFARSPPLQEAARVRIGEMQTKLAAFPQDLPRRLIAPTGILVDAHERIFGYTMPFVHGKPLDVFVRESGVQGEQRTSVLLLMLFDLVHGLHNRGVVIGDCNDRNIIVTERGLRYIDADSMQFGSYQCRTFTPQFVAPELVAALPHNPSQPAHVAPLFAMVAPHTEATDWYAFLVIAMRLLTHTDPYGGVVPEMDLVERLRQRVTVFDTRVTYPVVARPLATVPRPILEAFYRAFHRGERFVPDRAIFKRCAPVRVRSVPRTGCDAAPQVAATPITAERR